MQFFTTLAALATFAAALVSAENIVHFRSLDKTDRTLVFTGSAPLANLVVPGGKTISQTFPQGWIGNVYSFSAGAANVPGMLAEFTFQGWNGINYFDVSAIVDPTDFAGVHKIFPKSQDVATPTLFSGCGTFPCNTAYYHPDDVQTVTTHETEFICTLGGQTTVAHREVGSTLVERKFVLGQL